MVLVSLAVTYNSHIDRNCIVTAQEKEIFGSTWTRSPFGESADAPADWRLETTAASRRTFLIIPA